MSDTQSATSYNANAIAVAQRLETVRQQVQSRKATNKPWIICFRTLIVFLLECLKSTSAWATGPYQPV